MDLTRLRRFPDIEAENLQAFDATDRLLLELAGDLRGERVAIIDDHYGALSIGAILDSGAEQVAVYQDSIIAEQALEHNAADYGVSGQLVFCESIAAACADATVVLWQLPKALSAVEHYSQEIAAAVAPGATLWAGGRIKHLTLRVNDVLGQDFGAIQPQLAKQKSRVLKVTNPQPRESSGYPVFAVHQVAAKQMELWGNGATFGVTKLDVGTRELLRYLPDMMADAFATGANSPTIVDLGCGNGTIGVRLALADSHVQVIGTDISRAAIAATMLTAKAAGVERQVRVVRANGAEGIADTSVELVVCNPPFHMGAVVNEDLAPRLFAEAGRVLRREGSLWTVFNAHLRYGYELRQEVGPTMSIGKTPKFTVTRSLSR